MSFFFWHRQRDIKRLAYHLAIRNNIIHTFNSSKESAGKKWLQLLFKRHRQLSMRTPQDMSAAQIKSFTPENVSKFLTYIHTRIDEAQQSISEGF